MTLHPDLEAEQAYIDLAYQCLAAARQRAGRLQSMVEVGQGGTEQARFERDVIWDTILHRLTQLHLGDASLCFGRIDREPEAGAGTGETYYIGRISVADADQEPVVVDWRAPVAEPFYRATGRQSMGLARRRHFATRGPRLLDIEDELFGDRSAHLGHGADGISGYGSLISALETARSGRLGDIVATIQREQDEIIRAPLPGVLVVQGGPGTGKTVVALHRAAYLLYTHRFPLEDQGVLVVGPNRLFLSYIEQVLPSLGEAGVEMAVLADLVDTVSMRGSDTPPVARVKGDERMARVVAKAIGDRERGLRRDLHVGVGLQTLTLRAERSKRIVREARRRFRTHNAGRRFVEQAVYQALADTSRTPLDGEGARAGLHHNPDVRAALEWMWPVLSPADLLHDLFGSKALLRLATGGVLEEDEAMLLHRTRCEIRETPSGVVAASSAVVWTADDVPLLDEARAGLGRMSQARRRGESDEVRTYGHIVVDEAQDLSPMQLRMLTRRSLSGSMTVVGDIAQSTGAWAHADWDEVLARLPDRRPAARAELTVGYRIPAPNMELAARVLALAAPTLRPPTSVRQDGRPPRIVGLPVPAEERPGESILGALGEAIAAAVTEEIEVVAAGNVAVICPASMADEIDRALTLAGMEHGVAMHQGLDHQVTVMPVSMVKGLELDATVVVEPGRIIDEEPQGLRALYVALTRATKILTLVHTGPLPAVLAD